MIDLGDRLRRRAPIFAVNCGGYAPPAVDAVAAAGAHALFVDCERTPIAIDQVALLARIARADGIAALARVAHKDAATVIRTLDCDVDGLVLPQVESRAEWDAIVASARAQAPRRAGLPVLVAQIESDAGLARLEEIATAPGVAAILFGPNDLAISLGRPGEPDHPEVRAALADAAARLVALGVPFGRPATATSLAEEIERGASLFYLTLAQLVAPTLADLARRAEAVRATAPAAP